MQNSVDIQEQVVFSIREFVNSFSAKDNVVADMTTLVNVTDQLPLAHFDFWERLIRSEFSNAIEQAPRYQWMFRFKPQPRKILTWLDVISWDGHEREKALRTISCAAPNAFFFTMVLRRLNDWVPQVRQAAREQILKIAEQTSPQVVADAIAITIVNWSSWERIEKADRQALLQLTNRKEVVEILTRKLIETTSGPMPSMFSQLGRTSAFDESLSTIAQNAIQPPLRAKAYRSLFERRLVWSEGHRWVWTDIRYCEGRKKPAVFERELKVSLPFIEILNQSANDRSPTVRKVAAEFLIKELENLGSVSKYYALQFEADESESVAERGRFALKKLDDASGNVLS